MQNCSKKLWSKYTLYLLCFMALSFIEFLRSTQTGDIWKPAANCTGFVMMVIIFSQLPIKQFLRPISYIYTILCIVAIGCTYYHWTHHIGEYSFGQAATAIMNIWWLGLVISYFLCKAIKEKKIGIRVGTLGWTWILLVLWTLISVASRWWPVWYFFMFGSFYLIRFNNEDKTALLEAMIDGTIVSFFVMQCYAYLFRPFDVVRYKGAFANSNMMALYYLIVYCMILFKIHLLHVRKAKWGWKLFYYIGAAGLLGFQFLTICRTSWVCSIVVTVCYGWVVLRNAWGDSIRKLILKGCALAVTVAVVFPLVFLTVRWLPTVHPHPIWHEGEWRTDSVFPWDPADSEKYIEMDEFLDAALGRIFNMLQMFDARNPFVLHAYAGNEADIVPEPDYDWLSNSMSVRKVFFQTYWEHATWLGHPEQDGHYIFEESKVYMWHGQNLWIQIVYYFGYPAGMLLAILIVLVLVKVIKKAKMIKSDAYAMIPLIICLVYFSFGLVEVVWNPGQLVLALIFFIMHPQFTENCECLKSTGKQELSEKA